MRLAGHSTVAAMRIASLVVPSRLLRRGAPVLQTSDLDRTGILVNSAKPLKIVWEDSDVIFPMYEFSLAHSFWRAQEFSLFRRSRAIMRNPILDLGCGDGSFAAALFDRIDYGTDIDEDALKIARAFGVYSNLIHTSDTQIPLPDASVNTVISNSVLEHVKNLDAVVSELGRIIAANGLLIFSVPVRQFARDLQTYFGSAESDRVNTDFYHRNLLEIEGWKELLGKHNFAMKTILQFQPDWFSFYYWMLRFTGRRGLGRAIPTIRDRIWRRRGPRLVRMVKDSIDGSVEAGGNIFVVACKLA